MPGTLWPAVPSSPLPCLHLPGWHGGGTLTPRRTSNAPVLPTQHPHPTCCWCPFLLLLPTLLMARTQTHHTPPAPRGPLGGVEREGAGPSRPSPCPRSPLASWNQGLPVAPASTAGGRQVPQGTTGLKSGHGQEGGTHRPTLSASVSGDAEHPARHRHRPWVLCFVQAGHALR